VLPWGRRSYRLAVSSSIDLIGGLAIRHRAATGSRAGWRHRRCPCRSRNWTDDAGRERCIDEAGPRVVWTSAALEGVKINSSLMLRRRSTPLHAGIERQWCKAEPRARSSPSSRGPQRAATPRPTQPQRGGRLPRLACPSPLIHLLTRSAVPCARAAVTDLRCRHHLVEVHHVGVCDPATILPCRHGLRIESALLDRAR